MHTKVPQIKEKLSNANGNRNPISEKALAETGKDVDLNAGHNCAKFAIMALGRIHGKELSKRGVYADAWTMLYSIRAKEKQDKVVPGTYVKLVANLSLDHKYYYNPETNKTTVKNSLLYNEDYQFDFLKLFAAGKKLAEERKVAFMTYYYHGSPNFPKALAKTSELRRKGTDMNDLTPTTHIEIITGMREMDFMKNEIIKAISKSSENTGSYAELLLSTYIKGYIKPIEENKNAGTKEKALSRLSVLAKSGVKIFLTNSKGKKREVKLSVDDSEIRMIDSDGNAVLYDKTNPESVSFMDISSRTFGGKTNSILRSYLLHRSKIKSPGENTWLNMAPGKILDLTGLKWPEPNTPEGKRVMKLIKKYESAKGLKDSNLDEFFEKKGIAKKDLPYFYEALRRLGVDPSRISKNFLSPVFDMKKLKEMFFNEVLESKNPQVKEKLKSEMDKLNQAIDKESDSVKKNNLIAQKDALIAKVVLPNFSAKRSKEEAILKKKFFSNEGLSLLNKKIENSNSLIEATKQQIQDLTHGRGVSARYSKVKSEEKHSRLLNPETKN
jgi:hypothetical protein